MKDEGLNAYEGSRMKDYLHMKDEGWRMQDQGSSMKAEGWRMKNKEWRMKNEEWRMKKKGFWFNKCRLGIEK